jgi:monoamine oxidase
LPNSSAYPACSWVRTSFSSPPLTGAWHPGAVRPRMAAVTVVVVGAGAAGLACAAELRRSGTPVVVVEARERVGGRILTIWDGAADLVEAGAQVVHGAAPLTSMIVARAGLRTEPLHVDEDVGVVVSGRRRTPPELARLLRPPPWVAAAGLPRAGPPALAAAALAALEPAARAVAAAWVQQTWGEDPDVLDVAAMAAAQPARPPGDARVLLDGYDAVTAALASSLDVHLRFPVERLLWEPGVVRVEGPAGAIDGTAAVLTPPPEVVTGLAVAPALPDAKRLAASVLRSSDGVVVVVALREPAARARWTLLVDPPGGLWRRSRGSRLLTGHLKGSAAERARRHRWNRAGLEAVLPLLGERPEDVQEVQIVDWGQDRWARGTYSAPVRGAAAAAQAWAAPVAGTLFFAGEASAGPPFAGLVEGALRSGLRAARQVLDGTSRAG